MSSLSLVLSYNVSTDIAGAAERHSTLLALERTLSWIEVRTNHNFLKSVVLSGFYGLRKGYDRKEPRASPVCLVAWFLS